MLWFKKYTLGDLSRFPGSSGQNVNTHLGIEFTEIGDDFVAATAPVDQRTIQPWGLLHGGVSCVLAESLGSLAATMCIDPSKQSALGIEINANHLRAVKEGTVTGICKPIRVGKTLHVWQTELFRDDGKLFCISRLTVAIRDT